LPEDAAASSAPTTLPNRTDAYEAAQHGNESKTVLLLAVHICFDYKSGSKDNQT